MARRLRIAADAEPVRDAAAARTHGDAAPLRRVERDQRHTTVKTASPGPRDDGEPLERRIAAALERRHTRRLALARFLGGVCRAGQATTAQPAPGRTLVASAMHGRALILYGFVERTAAHGARPATYEGLGPGAAAVAEAIRHATPLPVPLLAPIAGRPTGTAQLVIHPQAATLFAGLAGLDRFVDAAGVVEITPAELSVRAAALAPWLHPALRGAGSFSARLMHDARTEPQIGPRLWYLARRRRFLLLDDEDAFGRDATAAGFEPIPGTTGAYRSDSPSAARPFAALGDPKLAQTLDDLASRWPFAFLHLTCDDLASRLDNSGETPPTPNRSRRAPGGAAGRISFDPASGWFLTTDAAAAAELDLNDVQPAAAAGAKQRPAWGFRDTAQAAELRGELDDEAEGELLCRLIEGCVGPRPSPGANLPPTPAPPIVYDRFQIEGIQHAMRGPTTAISDDMGTGKTYQGAGIADAVRREKRGKGKDGVRVLVVAPADQLRNWTKRLTTVPSEPFKIVRLDPSASGDEAASPGLVRLAPKRQSDPMSAVEPQGQALVISYETVTALPSIVGLSWDVIIIDEAHNLKTPGSARNLALLGDLKQPPPFDCDRLVWMTGTDITDTIVDYWPFIATTLWRSGERPTPLERFRRIFNPRARPVADSMTQETAAAQTTDTDAIRMRRMGRLADALDAGPRIRRLKLDVYPTLIPKSAKAWLVPVTDPSVLEDARIEGETWDSLSQPLDLVERRRRVTDLASRRRRTAIAKIPHVTKAVLRVARQDDPILIFAHHTAAADDMHAALQSAGVDSVLAHGKNTSPTERALIAEAFNDGRWTVLVTTIMALYAGHTITRSRHAWFLELDHKHKHVEQCIDRLWRRGQTRNVRARFFHIAGSYDGRIAANIVGKANVADVATGDRRRRLAAASP